jgi:raffinose/stachyose/melibiose transport system substrate-binding protein
MKNKILAFVTACLLILSILATAGCSSTTNQQPAGQTSPGVTETVSAEASTAQPVETQKKEAVTLNLWHYWTGETDGNAIAFKKVLESYPAENPDIKLNVSGFPGADYTTKLKIAFAANEAPDIFNIQGLGNMEPLVTSGKILALDELMAKYQTKDKILPGSTNSFTFSDKVYGLPTITGLAIFFCNRELFEKAGVEIPNTFEELLNVIPKFNEKGITPMMFAGKELWPTMFYYDILAIREAGSKKCVDALQGKESFDQPEFVEAARLLQKLTDVKAYGKTDLSLNWDEGVQKFAQGGAAMLFNGTWVTGIISDPKVPVAGKIELRAFPATGGQYDNDIFGGCFESFCISAAVKDQDAAYSAISYLSQKMSSESLINGNGLPAWKTDASVDTSKLDPLVSQQVNLLSQGKDMCLWWDTVLGGKKADIHKALVMKLITKEITPEEYCKQMQAQVNGK